MARRRRSRLRRLLLAAVLAIAGGVAFATAVPLAWLAGNPPVASAFMLHSRFGRDPATGRGCETVLYRWVDGRSIPSAMRRAVVLAEDQRFLEHHGFDLRQVEQAVREHAREGRLRGASTLTQQLARNLLLWPGRSWLRKGIEAWYTVWMELAWSKARILELYLNVAQFGPCLYGVEAAAGRFFGVRAADLDARQAARLAAVLPSPHRLRADAPGPYLESRTRELLALLDARRDAPWLRGL